MRIKAKKTLQEKSCLFMRIKAKKTLKEKSCLFMRIKARQIGGQIPGPDSWQTVTDSPLNDYREKITVGNL